ncbi:MAG: hypothetical protein OEM92_02020 [Gammaproteobacteria bacterium]|nr:hypothetical protein [Gammaproteobacteria bacterium]MDH3362711.1 hypothetical protein [Gammaproteobacteria bacterium]
MFFVMDIRASPPRQCEDRIWRHLWELRDSVTVSVVLPTIVSSACPLLADERADAVLSATGIQVPQNSAWIPIEVDVSRFVNDSGDIRLGALEKVLNDSVDRGDSLHNSNTWSSTAVQIDSWLNRRLAVAVRGWGDLVRRRRVDPRAFQTLKELEDLAEFIGKTLRARSRALAREKGYCPAVDVAGTKVQAGGGEMKLRWRRAVDRSALRHRNLTTMSVWDVFPQGGPADLRYVDLLPLLRCANSLSFLRGVDISHWNVNEFRRFYERVGAILRCSYDSGPIAKQV